LSAQKPLPTRLSTACTYQIRKLKLVRFTSELAKHVTGHHDCKNHGYDEDFLVATLDTIKFWIPNKAGSSFSIHEVVQVIYKLGGDINDLQGTYGLLANFSGHQLLLTLHTSWSSIIVTLFSTCCLFERNVLQKDAGVVPHYSF